MAKQATKGVAYTVKISDDPKIVGSLRFVFVPEITARQKAQADTMEPLPQYTVSVQGHGTNAQFEWRNSPGAETAREQLEEIARQRTTARNEWLEKLSNLVTEVKGWARGFEWSTKIVEKKMSDPDIGDYKAPALLLQRETVRLFLEPIARDAPGTEGLVDLYLMPSYDDIASLYYYKDRWNVHYMSEGAPTVGNIREAEGNPLTKETLQKVLEEMQSHAQ
jgi:hypothetical protein